MEIVFALTFIMLWTFVFGQNTGSYHTIGETLHLNKLFAAHHSDVLRFQKLVEGSESLYVTTITNNIKDLGTRRLTRSTPQSQNKSKLSVVLVFGEHAREVITTELGLWLTRFLVGNYSELLKWPEFSKALRLQGFPETGLRKKLDDTRNAILDSLVIKVVPVENLSGRHAWERGRICLRTAPQGVDLNRNWPFAWRRESPGQETFGGAEPLSEPQTRLLLALLQREVPKAFVNVHSGEWAAYCGWDSKHAVGPGLPGDMDELLEILQRSCRCKAGPAGAVSEYLAFGTSMDFVHTQLGVPYAITLELYGSGGVGRLREGEMNPKLSTYPYVEDPAIAELPGDSETATEAGVRGTPKDLWSKLGLGRRLRGHGHGHSGASGQSTTHRPDSDQTPEPPFFERASSQKNSPSFERAQRSRSGEHEHQEGGGAPMEGGNRGAVTPGARGANLGPVPFSLNDTTQSYNIEVLIPDGRLKGRSSRRREEEERSSPSGEANRWSLLSTQQDSPSPAKFDGSGSDGGPSAPSILMKLVDRQFPHQRRCFTLYNPPEGAPYRDVISTWLAALVGALRHVADPGVPRPSAQGMKGTVLDGRWSFVGCAFPERPGWPPLNATLVPVEGA